MRGRKWTVEERNRQAELIRNWQPWKTVGAKSPEAKAKCRMNAMKHGIYSEETKAMRRAIALCGKVLRTVRAQLANEAAAR